jgi:HAD superfamily hydrolase (TIGR01509 family)
MVREAVFVAMTGDVLQTRLGQLEALRLALTGLDQGLLGRVVAIDRGVSTDVAGFVCSRLLLLFNQLAVGEGLLLGADLLGTAHAGLPAGAEWELRASAQPAMPPVTQPTPKRVTARTGRRLSFAVAPWAVCFAVDLTALRAMAFLIDGMEPGYPVCPGGNRGYRAPMSLTAILDVDGTLVDTNYHHALAWHRALHAHDYPVAMWRVHRHIGMGGDKIVTALVGEEAERTEGDAIRKREGEVYGELIGEVEPMAEAHELIADLHEDGTTVILASSAKEEEVDHYLDLLDARDLIDGWTTSADVEETKPAADLVQVALQKTGGGPTLMIGDSSWDVKAASAAGVPTLAVLTGGFSAAELKDAGAVEVVESIAELRRNRERIAALAS